MASPKSPIFAVSASAKRMFAGLTSRWISPFSQAARSPCAIWIPIYVTLAFRRVYGGRIGSTIAKELGIGAIYAAISALAFAIMIYWVSVAA